MTARQPSPAVLAAIRAVQDGATPREAMALHGVKRPTLYAALKRAGVACDRSAARKKAWADPEARARMSAARKKAWAKRAVAMAGLPLLKRLVARAAQLFAAGYDIKSVAHALRREEREREVA